MAEENLDMNSPLEDGLNLDNQQFPPQDPPQNGAPLGSLFNPAIPSDFAPKIPTQQDVLQQMDQMQAQLDKQLQQVTGGRLGGKGYSIHDAIANTNLNSPLTSYPSHHDLYGPPSNQEVVGKTSSQLAADNLFNVIANTGQYAVNEYKFVAPQRFGADYKHYNVARYTATDEFNQYGFSPFRDNEKYYEEHLSNWSDFTRSTQGFFENFSIGWDSYWDTWLGDPGYEKIDVYNAERLAQNAATYNSRRGSNTAILGNSISQAGLGLGMAAGFGTELIATSLATGGTGGFATVGKGLTKIPTILKAGTKLSTFTKNIGNFAKTVKSYGQFKKLIQVPGKVAGKLVPNTIKGWNTAYHGIKNGTGFNLAAGLGNAYKDYRIVNMALSEAGMEGGMVYADLEKELLDKFRKDNDGRMPNAEEYKDLQNTANLGAVDAYGKNFMIIYGSNLFVWNRLFSGFGSKIAGKMGGSVTRNAAGKIVFDPKLATRMIKPGIKGIPGKIGLAKNYVLTPRAWGKGLYHISKAGLNYAKANVVEGLQELGQEVVADAAKDYYTNIYTTEKGNATVGDWYRLAFKHFEKYKSHKGYEIFMSGFLMGGIAGMPQTAAQKTIEFGVSKGVGGKTRKEQYNSYMAAKKEELDKYEKAYETISNDPEYFFSNKLENLITQQKIRQEMDIAEEMGDKKSWLGYKEDGDFLHVKTVIDSGAFDFLMNTLNSKKEMSLDDFNQAFNTNFKTDQEKIAAVDDWISNAEMIKDNYDEVQSAHPNPHNPNLYTKGTEEHIKEFIKYRAHEKYIEEYSLNKYKLEKAVDRRIELYDKLKSEPWYRFKKKKNQGLEKKVGVTGSDINSLLDPIVLSREINTLALEIAELNRRKEDGVLDAVEKESLKYKEKLFNSLNNFKDQRARYKFAIEEKSIVLDEETNTLGRYTPEQIAEQEAALKDFQKAWVNAVKTFAEIEGESTFDEDIRQSFVEIKDMLELEDDIKEFNATINYIASPNNYADMMYRSQAAMLKQFENRHQTMMKHYKASYERQENSGFESILAAEGYRLTIEGRTRLMEEGLVPQEFLTEDGSMITEVDPEYAKPEAITLEWLKEVREKGEGLTREEYDQLQKEKMREEEAAEEEEVTPEEEEKGPTKLTKTTNNNSNYKSWANVTRVDEAGQVKNLQDEANEIFQAEQERLRNAGQKEFASIDSWIEKGANDELSVLLGKYNAYREAEFKKTQAEKQKKKSEAGKQPPKPSPTKTKRAEIEKQYNDVSEIVFNADTQKKFKAVTAGPLKGSRTTEEALKELDVFLEKTLGWVGIKSSFSKQDDSFNFKINNLNFSVPGYTGSSNNIATLGIELKDISDAKYNAEIEALEGEAPAPTPTPEVTTEGNVRDEETSAEPQFVPQGKTIQEKVNSIVEHISKNQEFVKTYSSLTEAERSKYGVKKGAHGYLVNAGTKQNPKWIKATSVTQAIGTTFEMNEGTQVELPDGRKGVIQEGPVENSDRIVNEEDPRTDTYSVLVEGGEIVEATRSELKNLDFIDSSIAGTKIDVIVRDFFLGNLDETKVPEGIESEQYKQLIKTLKAAKDQFETDKLEVLANNVILFDANAPGGPIAGEVDLLLYSKKTGRFYIYDMKTSKYSFWEKASALKASKLSFSFAEKVHTNVRGVSRTKKKGYELQQSTYKNLFEKQYGARIGTNSDSGIYLLPYKITYNKDGFITEVNPERKINLSYAFEVSQWTHVVEPSFTGVVLDEGGRTVQPQQFEGEGWTEEVGIKKVGLDINNRDGKAITEGSKSTILKSSRELQSSKINFLKELLAVADLNILGKYHRAISYGSLTYQEAGKKILEIANKAKEMHVINQQAGLGTPSKVPMTEEMADKIIAINKRTDLVASEKAQLTIVTSENLPTKKPQGWKSENPFTIKGKTYYSESSSIAKWLGGNRKMVLISISPQETIEITPEMMQEPANLFNEFAQGVRDAKGLDPKTGRLAIRSEIRNRMNELIAQGEQPTGINELQKLLAEKESELADKILASFEQIKTGDTLVINSEHIATFGKVVNVLKKGPKQITVSTEMGKNKRIYKSNFSQIVSSVNNLVTTEKQEVVVKKEEKQVTKNNSGKSKGLTFEQREKARKAAENKSADDVLSELINNVEKDC